MNTEFKQVMHDYQQSLIDEDIKIHEADIKVLDEVKSLVSESYFKSIQHFIDDEDNGIWGNFKIVTETIGDWQYEEQDEDELNYWNDLKGMYVNQSCGYSGDDYSGTVMIKLTDTQFFKCSYSL